MFFCLIKGKTNDKQIRRGVYHTWNETNLNVYFVESFTIFIIFLNLKPKKKVIKVTKQQESN